MVQRGNSEILGLQTNCVYWFFIEVPNLLLIRKISFLRQETLRFRA